MRRKEVIDKYEYAMRLGKQITLQEAGERIAESFKCLAVNKYEEIKEAEKESAEKLFKEAVTTTQEIADRVSESLRHLGIEQMIEKMKENEK